jgi:hypothetical protein
MKTIRSLLFGEKTCIYFEKYKQKYKQDTNILRRQKADFLNLTADCRCCHLRTLKGYLFDHTNFSLFYFLVPIQNLLDCAEYSRTCGDVQATVGVELKKSSTKSAVHRGHVINTPASVNPRCTNIRQGSLQLWLPIFMTFPHFHKVPRSCLILDYDNFLKHFPLFFYLLSIFHSMSYRMSKTLLIRIAATRFIEEIWDKMLSDVWCFYSSIVKM